MHTSQYEEAEYRPADGGRGRIGGRQFNPLHLPNDRGSEEHGSQAIG